MPDRADVDALIAQADRALRSRRFAEAEACARNASEREANNGAAWYLLGHALLASGKTVEGGAAFARSVELEPANADARIALAKAATLTGDWQGAALQAEQAVALRPAQIDFHLLLLTALASAGQWERMRAALARALGQTGDPVLVHERAGQIFQESRFFADAESQYRRALAGAPARAGVMSNLGLLLLEKNEVVEAEGLLRKALALSPSAEAHNNLGYACLVAERYDEALTQFQSAVALKPALAPAHANMAAAFHRQGKLEAAFDALLKGLSLNPAEPQAWYNLALLLQEPDGFLRMRRWKDATANQLLVPLQGVLAIDSCADAELFCLRKAVEQRPHWPVAQFNLGIAALRGANWRAGWNGYAFRPARPGLRVEATSTSSLSGKKVRLHAEQGLGDILFFLRFVPSLISLGCKVQLVGAERLHAVLAANGLMSLSPAEDAWEATQSDKEVSLWLGDLPGLLAQLGMHDVPPPLPLVADVARVSRVEELLKSCGPPPYLGLTWRAGTARAGRGVNVLDKQLSPHSLADVLEGLPVTGVALQRQATNEEIAAAFKSWGRQPVNLAAQAEAPEDALALLSVLDHYVGVSNTNMHLRASLQRPSHVLVPHPPEWRWGSKGDRSPWFPQTWVYRQTADLEWHEALKCLRQDLLADIKGRSR